MNTIAIILGIVLTVLALIEESAFRLWVMIVLSSIFVILFIEFV